MENNTPALPSSMPAPLAALLTFADHVGSMVAATAPPESAEDAVAGTLAATAFVGQSLSPYGPEYVTAVLGAFERGYVRTRMSERTHAGNRYFYGHDEDGDRYAVAVDMTHWFAEYQGYVSAGRTLGPATWTLVDRAWLAAHAADEVSRWRMVADAPDVLALIDAHQALASGLDAMTDKNHA